MTKNRFWIRLFAAAVSFIGIAVAAQCAESPEDTKKFYETLVRAQPANPNAHFDLGNVYLREKRYDDALKQYREAGKVGLAAARMGSYYFNMAVCYAGLGKTGDAIKSLEECLKVNPSYREAKDLLEIYKRGA